MSEREVLVGVVLEEGCLTVEQVAAACFVEPAWVVRLVEDGLFSPVEGDPGSWRFSRAALIRARRIREIERTFDAVPELAALVADLLEEMDGMRAAMRKGGMG